MADPKEPSTTIDHVPVDVPLRSSALPSWYLLLEGPGHHRSIELVGVMCLGRAETCEISVAEPSLSRMHASFRGSVEGVTITDLASRNGVIVDGQRVQEALLKPGQRAALGSMTVTVHAGASSFDVSLGSLPYPTFLATLGHEIERARTVSRPLSVLFVRALEGVARASLLESIRPSMRAIDAVCRYGEGALLWCAPELDVERARELAAKAVASSKVPVAFGIASYPASASSAHELISEAQTAARAASRNERVAVSAPKPKVRDAVTSSFVARRSPAMLALDNMIERVAARDLPVLVTGETGSGKEHAARAIHEKSPRAQKPMRAVNCAAIAGSLLESFLFGHERGAFTGADKLRVGVFEEANGGTVFLDEVGELSPAAQAALLRVLESRTIIRVGSTRELFVDVRLVAATHRDLDAMVARGEFRMDLLHRLNAVVLRVPPLRERVQEIRPLSEFFLEQAASKWNAAEPEVDEAVFEALERYAWPGNARELRNVMERALALSDGARLSLEDLPDHVRAHPSAVTVFPEANPNVGGSHRERVREQELQAIKDALARTGGNRKEAAKLIGMPLRTLQRRLSESAELRDKKDET